ncbi:MAG: Trk system potassium transporter TrkA [Candidatus Omnitrophica bacterium]|nr:Trk system potassium transporter TrkA [Candidatus Omnitrophota bacterium]
MRIIIVGAGRIGMNLAKTLTKENNEVYMIESDPDTALNADEKLDVKVITGNGANPKTLKIAQAHRADLVIAVTMSDETNLVVSSLASYYGAKRCIARVRNTNLSQEIDKSGYHHFHIDEIINPEEVAGEAIVKTIEAPGACEVADFADGRILLRSFDISLESSLCGTKISDFGDDDFPWPFLIVAIRRQGEVIIPKGETHVERDDRIYVLLPTPSLGEFITFVDPESRKPNKIIIYGATKTGEHVAQALFQDVKDIILIEESPHLAALIASQIPGVRIINGSASEKDILKECGIEAADIFIAATDNDHSNLISAVLAKRMGAKKTIITTQQPDYTSIVGALEIDAIVSPHLLAVEQILRYVRGKGISAITKFLDCDAEAVEFICEAGAPITKKALKDLTFPQNSIVGAVDKGSEVVLAKGDTQINAGERVIVFCQESAVKKLQSLFTHKKMFKK